MCFCVHAATNTQLNGKLQGDQKLRNDLLDLLEKLGIPGWTHNCVDTSGERCIQEITQALWYIDTSPTNSIKLPETFASFQVGVWLQYCMYIYLAL